MEREVAGICFFDGHCRVEPFFEEDLHTALHRRFERDALRGRDTLITLRVDMGAARKQARVPARCQRPNQERCADNGERKSDASEGKVGRKEQDENGRDKVDAHGDSDRGLGAESRDEKKTSYERARDGAERIERVDVAHGASETLEGRR